MNKIESTQDYSEFLIRCKKAIISIEREFNKKNFDSAGLLAHQLEINAHLMRDAITREELRKRS